MQTPEIKSQIFIVLSIEPVATVLTDISWIPVIIFECPLSVLMHLFDFKHHTLASPLGDPLINLSFVKTAMRHTEQV